MNDNKIHGLDSASGVRTAPTIDAVLAKLSEWEARVGRAGDSPGLSPESLAELERYAGDRSETLETIARRLLELNLREREHFEWLRATLQGRGRPTPKGESGDGDGHADADGVDAGVGAGESRVDGEGDADGDAVEAGGTAEATAESPAEIARMIAEFTRALEERKAEAERRARELEAEREEAENLRRRAEEEARELRERLERGGPRNLASGEGEEVSEFDFQLGLDEVSHAFNPALLPPKDWDGAAEGGGDLRAEIAKRDAYIRRLEFQIQEMNELSREIEIRLSNFSDAVSQYDAGEGGAGGEAGDGGGAGGTGFDVREIAELQSQLESARRQADELFQAMDRGEMSLFSELANQRERYELERKAFENQIQELNRELREFREERDRRRANPPTESELVAELENRLAESLREKEELAAKLDESFRKAEEVFAELGPETREQWLRDQSALEDLREEKAIRDRQIKELQFRLKELQSRLEAEESEKTDEARVEPDEAAARLGEIEKERDEARAQAESLFRMLDGSRQDMYLELEDERRRAADERKRFNERIEALERELEEARARGPEPAPYGVNELLDADSDPELVDRDNETTFEGVLLLQEAQELSGTTTEGGRLRERLEEARRQLAEQREVVDSLREELERTRAELVAAREGASAGAPASGSATSDEDPRLVELSDRVAAFAEENLKTSARLTAALDRNEALQKELDRTRERLGALESGEFPIGLGGELGAAEELEKLRAENRELREKLESAAASQGGESDGPPAGWEEALRESEQVIGNLQAQIVRLQDEYQDRSSQLRQAEDLLREAQAATMKHQQDEEILVARIARLEEELERIAAAGEGQAAGAFGSGAVGDAEARLAEARAAIEESERERERLETRIEELAAELREANEGRARLEIEIEKVRDVAGSRTLFEQEASTLKEEMIRMSRDLEEQERQREELRMVKGQLERARAELEETLDRERSMQQKVNFLEGEVQRLRLTGGEGLETGNEDADRLREELREFREREAELRAELEEARKRVEEKERDRAELERKATELNEALAEVDRLTGILTDAEQQFGEMERELEKARAAAAGGGDLASELTVKDRTIRELEARLAQTLPGHDPEAGGSESPAALENLRDENRLLQSQLAELRNELESLDDLRAAVMELETTRKRLIEIQREAHDEIEQMRIEHQEQIVELTDKIQYLETQLNQSEVARAQAGFEDQSLGSLVVPSQLLGVNAGAPTLTIDEKIRAFRQHLADVHKSEVRTKPKKTFWNMFGR